MAKSNQTELGKEIKKRLADLHWSQRELARRTDISHSNISKIMRGIHRPTPETLTMIGKALSVDPFYLMDLAGIPLPEDRSKRDPAIEHVAQRLEQLSPQVKSSIIVSIEAQIDAIEAIEVVSKPNPYDTAGPRHVVAPPIYEDDLDDEKKRKVEQMIMLFGRLYPQEFMRAMKKLGPPPKTEVEFA